VNVGNGVIAGRMPNCRDPIVAQSQTNPMAGIFVMAEGPFNGLQGGWRENSGIDFLPKSG
jgi:hypothetical protein